MPQMTAFARRLLREGFLKADMGISGGNFGVAETGSLCICTNEGNGRLTTTLPRVHVALMGIERIVPTLADLGIMLQVLGRSATGQKLTVYSNIITGPRRHGAETEGDESDGPDHLHIVLVDNGRSRLLGTDLAEVLYCIRCGACLNACPVYQEVGGHAYGSVYPGPVGAVLTPGLRGLAKWHDLPHASSLCGACREICPVRIDIPRMLLTLRDQATERGYSPAWITSGLWFFRQLAVRPALFPRAQALASFATRRIAKNGWIERMPGSLRPVDADAGLSGVCARDLHDSVGAPSPMSDDRFNIMAAVAQRLRAGVMPPAGRLEHPGAAAVSAPSLSRDELIAHFTAEAEALTVVVHRVARRRLGRGEGERCDRPAGATRVLAWDDKWLNCQGLADSLRTAGITLESCWLPRDGDRTAAAPHGARRRRCRHDWRGRRAGRYGKSRTREWTGPRPHRVTPSAASHRSPPGLATARHLCGVSCRASGIEDVGSNLVLVTGPSRTADIEMTLTRGVHGPGEVHVVLIDA